MRQNDSVAFKTGCQQCAKNKQVDLQANRYAISDEETQIIQLNRDNAVRGELPNKQKLLALMDSGASYSLISADTIQHSGYLRNIKPEFVKSMPFIVGNGEKVYSNQMVTFQIKFQHSNITVTAYIVENLGGFDCVIGNSTLKKLKGVLDFETNKLKIKNKSILVKAANRTVLNPNQVKTVRITCKAPDFVRNAAVILKLNKFISKLTPENVLVRLRKGNAFLILANNTDKKIVIQPSKAVGCICLNLLGKVYHSVQFPGRGENTKDQTENSHCFAAVKETSIDRDALYKDKLAKYPFLEPSDEKLRMTDEEILQKHIKLGDSSLSSSGKIKIVNMFKEKSEVFSLHSEVGHAKQATIDFNVTDETPFYIRPYVVSEAEKVVIDKELDKLKLMGVVTECRTPYTSPMMVIKGKHSTRAIADLRHLNKRLEKQNYPFPLIRDTIQLLGGSECKYLSVVDIKRAYHSIPLSERSSKYCGIATYFGGRHAKFLKIPMGLSIAPAIWQNYIENLLDEIPNRRSFLHVHMDDIIIRSKTETEHISHVEQLLDLLIKHGLKISPDKTQIASKVIDYMGHNISIANGKPVISAQKSKTEAISNLSIPTNVKSTRSFIGMCCYLSMYLPKLQELLIPFYDLTKKKAKFEITDVHKTRFEEIKKLLTSPPVLSMPNNHGKLVIYSDTSKLATGAALYQIQEGEEKLLGYHSKILPKACARYSISELELQGLVYNISCFKYLLRGTHFQAFVDHSSLVQIVKAKSEPPTTRLRKLLEKLGEYSFDLGYLKGKLMHVPDFLSRNAAENDSCETPLKPIAFLNKKVHHVDPLPPKSVMRGMSNNSDYLSREPQDQYNTMCTLGGQAEKESNYHRFTEQISNSMYSKDATVTDNDILLQEMNCEVIEFPIPAKAYVVTRSMAQNGKPQVQADTSSRVTRSTARDQGIVIPEIKGTDRPIEYQKRSYRNVNREPLKIVTNPTPLKASVTQTGNLETESVVQGTGYNLRKRIQISAPQQQTRDKTLVESVMSMDNGPSIRKLAENPNHSNSLGDEIEFAESHRFPSEDDFPDLKPLFNQKGMSKILTRNLSKQCDIDVLLNQIKKKALRDYNLPLEAKEIAKEQRKDPHFKAIYEYLASGYLPSNKKEARRVLLLSEQFVIVENVLFRVYIDKRREDIKTTLVIPNALVHHILNMYHDSILASHNGINRTLLTLRRLFYIPNAQEKVTQYIKACSFCQEFKDPGRINYPTRPRLSTDFSPFSVCSADLKSMPVSSDNHKHILVVICNMTRYVKTFPLKEANAITIADKLIQEVFLQHGKPKTLIMDAGPQFCNQLADCIWKTLKVKQTIVSPHNHGSLQVERAIRTISNYLTANIRNRGSQWPLYVQAATYSHNSFASENLGGYSPYYLVHLRHPGDYSGLEFTPISTMASSYKEYIEILRRRFEHIRQTMTELQALKQENQAVKTKFKSNVPHFYEGMLVFVLNPAKSELQLNSRKFQLKWTGPYILYELLDQTHAILQGLDGKIIAQIIHIRRLKPAFLRGENKIASNVDEVREMLLKANMRKDKESAQVNEKEDKKLKVTDEKGSVHLTISANNTEHKHLFSIYAGCESRHGGIAVPRLKEENVQNEVRTNKIVTKLYKKLAETPETGEDYSISKARFKHGHLEILTVNDKNPSLCFWFKTNESLEGIALAQHVLENRNKFRITGTPQRWINTIYGMC